VTYTWRHVGCLGNDRHGTRQPDSGLADGGQTCRWKRQTYIFDPAANILRIYWLMCWSLAHILIGVKGSLLSNASLKLWVGVCGYVVLCLKCRLCLWISFWYSVQTFVSDEVEQEIKILASHSSHLHSQSASKWHRGATQWGLGKLQSDVYGKPS
jgi:hypothetical protein